jgi:polyferredoxin
MNQQRLSQLRRLSQVLFLAVFVLLLLKTEYRGSLKAIQDDLHSPYPIGIFLEADPLVAIGNALASHSLYRGLLWSLVVLIPTLFLGRLFCGWICPFGTLNHFFGSIRSQHKRGPRLLESNRYKSWQTTKYSVLIAVLITAVLGGQISGLLDPISLLVRSLTISILPGINYAFNELFDFFYKPGLGLLRPVADALQFILGGTLLSFKQPHFRQGFFVGLILALVLLLNLRVTRFWCRALCPLGALLGLLSRWSVLGLEKHPSHCEDCNRCLLHCQGGDDPIPGAKWRKAECHLCFNCVSDCPKSGIKFKFFPATQTTIEGAALLRRQVLVSAATGAALLPVLRSAPGFSAARDARLIRPPGSLDEANFLARCIRCGECMKVCPTNALHPTLMEAGVEGLWTPVLVPRVGYCEPSCTLCSRVCPTGAIWEITPIEKGWVATANPQNNKPVRLGTAFYDRGRCLPWAMATECIVCEEWCPTSPKAIYLRPAEVIDSRGVAKQVRQPFLDPERCIGCGACEFACPVKDRPAIYVTSIGESRSKTNQILLKAAGKGRA